MRFVSKFKKYMICYQSDIVEHFATGESRVLRPLLNCQFDQFGSLLPHEMVMARTMVHHGIPTEADGMTSLDPAYRFSVFDTVAFQKEHGLSEDERTKLETFLLERYENGNDYIMVPAPQLAAPWPTYDEFRGVRGLPTAQAIVKKVQEDGYDVAEVVAYERQNANRQDVIDALESSVNEEPAVDVIHA